MVRAEGLIVEEERFAFFKHRWSEYKEIAGVKSNLNQELAICLSNVAAQGDSLEDGEQDVNSL